MDDSCIMFIIFMLLIFPILNGEKSTTDLFLPTNLSQSVEKKVEKLPLKRRKIYDCQQKTSKILRQPTQNVEKFTIVNKKNSTNLFQLAKQDKVQYKYEINTKAIPSYL